jgi:hypothetical protein
VEHQVFKERARAPPGRKHGPSRQIAVSCAGLILLVELVVVVYIQSEFVSLGEVTTPTIIIAKEQKSWLKNRIVKLIFD